MDRPPTAELAGVARSPLRSATRPDFRGSCPGWCVATRGRFGVHMICEFKWPNVSLSAAFQESEWGIGSTGGFSGSFEPFAEGPSINAGMLKVPFHRTDANGRVTETAILSGYGLGAGMSGGLQVPWVDIKNVKQPLKNAPFGAGGSTLQAPGSGTRVFTALGAKTKMEARDFEGLCVAGTVTGTIGGLSGSVSLLVFASQSCFSLGLPPAAQLALIRGLAICWGAGLASAIASAGGDATAYALGVTSDIKTPAQPGKWLRFTDWDRPYLVFKDWDKGER